MTKLPLGTILLVIDVQKAFDNPVWGQRNNPEAEKNIARLLAYWRQVRYPVIHIQHLNPKFGSLFNQDGPGFSVKDEARPVAGEPVLFKSVNSAFIGTDLEARLRAQSSPAVVIVGITTDHCVSTTTRMAGNLGFTALVVSDATATFERTGPNGRHWSADDMHDTALASLNHEFASVVTTSEILKGMEGGFPI